jgi:hypothetical protein
MADPAEASAWGARGIKRIGTRHCALHDVSKALCAPPYHFNKVTQLFDIELT